MHFLLWDAQRRAGITDDQITQAMVEKLAVNKQREWLEPKDGEPRLHIKEQSAPVVQDDGRADFEAWMLMRWGRERRDDDFIKAGFIYGEDYADSYTRCVWKAWSASRAAMLQAEPVTAANKLGNSPVIPNGYVMVPKESTEDMVIAGFESRPDEDFSEPEVWEEYQNMSGCQQAAHRARLCWAAMLAAARRR